MAGVRSLLPNIMLWRDDVLFEFRKCDCIKSIRQGKFILYISIAKRLISLVLIIIGTYFGIYGIVIGVALGSYLWVPINTYHVGKLTGYKFSKQLKDVGPSYLLSILTGFITFYLSSVVNIRNSFFLLAFQLITYCLLYGGSIFLLDRKGFIMTLEIAKDVLSTISKKAK